jgi:hypothetical protein
MTFAFAAPRMPRMQRVPSGAAEKQARTARVVQRVVQRSHPRLPTHLAGSQDVPPSTRSLGTSNTRTVAPSFPVGYAPSAIVIGLITASL